MFQIWWRSVHK